MIGYYYTCYHIISWMSVARALLLASAIHYTVDNVIYLEWWKLREGPIYEDIFGDDRLMFRHLRAFPRAEISHATYMRA